jgi:hypothetical protein
MPQQIKEEMTMKIRATCKIFVWVLAPLVLSGCAGFGPTTIPHDRFDYAEAISKSWKSQMLLNMVKIRYADVPIFVDVASVISQYTLQGEINLKDFGLQATPPASTRQVASSFRLR